MARISYLAPLLGILASACVGQGVDTQTRHDFSSPTSGTHATLSAYAVAPGPEIVDGVLRMLHGRPAEQSVVGFERSAIGPRRDVEISFRFHIDEGADGFGVALLPTSAYGETGAGPELAAWEEPNIPGALAVGFDVYDPPTDNPCDANGNIHKRPEREVSLHWDGVEVANALSPAEFRGGSMHEATIGVRFVGGGALVSVSIDGQAVYEDRLVPGAQAYESRLAIGARTGGLSTNLQIDDVAARYGPVTDPIAPVATVTVFDDELVHSGNREPTQTVALPDLPEPPGRVILRLCLQAPPGGFDPWDRSAAVYVWDGDDRYEVCRYITPYGRGHTWQVDVSDTQSLLRGQRKLGLYIDTWVGGDTPDTMKGWKVTVDLSYYPGPPRRVPVRVVNLWSGRPEYGNPEAPLSAFFEPRTVAVPNGVMSAKLRLTVTGHGQNPATKNAAEFLPADRTVTVNGARHENRLWKTDCYLNPCRPQGGTWKYDRAGWAPGDVVTPWTIDDLPIPNNREFSITYEPMEYVNENRDQARASHWVEGQLVLYE